MIRPLGFAILLFAFAVLKSPVAFADEAGLPAHEIAKAELATPYLAAEKRWLAVEAVSVPSECLSCGPGASMCGKDSHCLNGCCQNVYEKCVDNVQCAPGSCHDGHCDPLN